MEPHWSNEFEHESITDENREAFNTHMAKFPTQGDVVVNHLELSKQTGKPFKLPESMDKLPDDTSRSDFASQTRKLLGITHAASVEDLKDLDFTVGMEADDNGEKKIDEVVAGAIKQLIVDKKLNVGEASHYIEMHNKMIAKARRDYATAQQAVALKNANDTNEALIAHLGSKEEVAKQSELLRRAIKNHVGLTPVEYEEFGEATADAMLKGNKIMARVMLKVLTPLAAQSDLEGAGGGKPKVPVKDPDEGSPTYVALGYSKPKT